MAKKVERFQAEDGALFNTEKECEEYELNSAFLIKLHQIVSEMQLGVEGKTFDGGLLQRVVKAMCNGIINKQMPLRELLVWYHSEREALLDTFKGEGE